MSSKKTKASSKQQRAIEVLLVGGSDQQAAEAAGVTRPTVTDWRNKDEGFQEALATAKAELLKRTASRLHAATALAVRALEDVVKDVRNPHARVSAARAILEYSQRAHELQELEAKVEELETWFHEHKAECHS
jgi:AcrR family transcriptional regulator